MTSASRAGDSRTALQVALADDAAFERWYRATLPRVYSYLMSRVGGDIELAEDLTQQTFIAAIDRRARFDGRSDSVTWLCAIARHKLADHFRSMERHNQRRIRMEIRQLEVESAIRQPVPSDVAERELIARSLADLPPGQRAVLIFVALDGLSVAEAGRLLGRSPGATQSLLHRARAAFRLAYEGGSTDD